MPRKISDEVIERQNNPPTPRRQSGVCKTGVPLALCVGGEIQAFRSTGRKQRFSGAASVRWGEIAEVRRVFAQILRRSI